MESFQKKEELSQGAKIKLEKHKEKMSKDVDLMVNEGVAHYGPTIAEFDLGNNDDQIETKEFSKKIGELEEDYLEPKPENIKKFRDKKKKKNLISSKRRAKSRKPIQKIHENIIRKSDF